MVGNAAGSYNPAHTGKRKFMWLALLSGLIATGTFAIIHRVANHAAEGAPVRGAVRRPDVESTGGQQHQCRSSLPHFQACNHHTSLQIVIIVRYRVMEPNPAIARWLKLSHIGRTFGLPSLFTTTDRHPESSLR